ncbi:unnamed protein product [Urochloa humidicola]
MGSTRKGMRQTSVPAAASPVPPSPSSPAGGPVLALRSPAPPSPAPPRPRPDRPCSRYGWPPSTTRQTSPCVPDDLHCQPQRCLCKQGLCLGGSHFKGELLQGPQCVCTNFCTFVCPNCSGVDQVEKYNGMLQFNIKEFFDAKIKKLKLELGTQNHGAVPRQEVRTLHSESSDFYFPDVVLCILVNLFLKGISL